MKKPRLDPQAAFVRPAARTLMALLLRNDSPVRVQAAREELRLSIGQFGLAMRSLERHGLAQRRNLVAPDDEKRLHFLYLEATDLGREHTQAIGPAPAPA